MWPLVGQQDDTKEAEITSATSHQLILSLSLSLFLNSTSQKTAEEILVLRRPKWHLSRNKTAPAQYGLQQLENVCVLIWSACMHACSVP